MQSAKRKHQQGFYLFIGNSQRAALVMVQFIKFKRDSHWPLGCVYATRDFFSLSHNAWGYSTFKLLQACVSTNTSFISDEFIQLNCSFRGASTARCCNASVTVTGRKSSELLVLSSTCQSILLIPKLLILLCWHLYFYFSLHSTNLFTHGQ